MISFFFSAFLLTKVVLINCKSAHKSNNQTLKQQSNPEPIARANDRSSSFICLSMERQSDEQDDDKSLQFTFKSKFFSAKRVFLLCIIFVLFACIAVTFFGFYFVTCQWHEFVANKVIDSVLFKNNSEAYWRLSSTAYISHNRIKIFPFNVTNEKAFVAGSDKKLKLEQIGPLVYDIFKTKDIVKNNAKTGLIEYKLKTVYTFNEKHSAIKEPGAALITWPNVPILSAMNKLEKIFAILPYHLIKIGISAFLWVNKERPFFTAPVSDLIFDGFERPMFARLQRMVGPLVEHWPLKDNKFALMYKRNNTYDRNTKLDTDTTYTISSGFNGRQTYRDLNKYKFINGLNKTGYWPDESPNDADSDPSSYSCNNVGGTDGQFFSPLLETESIEVYIPDVCRRFTLRKSQDRPYVYRVQTQLYEMDLSDVRADTQQTKCYCLDPDSKQCSLPSLVDLQTCNHENIVASTPHFLSAEGTSLLSRIEGLSPDKQKHTGKLLIEPNTGITLKAYMPMQFNVRLTKNSLRMFEFFKDEEPLIIPLAWIVQVSGPSVEAAEHLHSQLWATNPDIVMIAFILLTCLFIVLMSALIVSIRCVQVKKVIQKDDQDLNQLVDSSGSYTNADD